MVRCKGKTAKGPRCRRQATAGKTRCWQHAPKTETEPEIWEQKGYPAPSASLSKRKINSIRAKLSKGPTKKDEPGYIYIYRLSTDKRGDEYYKIGRTVQPVKKRLRQWSKHAVLVEAFKVTDNRFCEALVHAYLDAWRVYRYKLRHGYCTVWKSSGEPVTELDSVLSKENRLEGRKKQIEWFCGKKEMLLEVVEKVCAKHIH